MPLKSSTLPALLAVLFLLFTASLAASSADDINAQWDDVVSTLSELRSACQPQASPAASRAASPAATRAASPAASRAASPAASRAASPAASRAASPAASPSPISPSPPPSPAAGLKTVTVGPGQTYAEPADAIPHLATGFTMTVLAGTYYKPFDIPNNLGPWTINGAGGGKTIFDGQGGAPAHRLSWGKGFVHTQSPGRITGIVFQNCGGADRTADGEAGLYAEAFLSPGTVEVDKCLFYYNENGIFVPPGSTSTSPGYGIAMVVTNSDFRENGQSRDGGSHDLYVNGASYTETNCNHYGNPYGNNIKVRAPVLSVTGGYHANTAGSRWIDYPNGGTATISGGTWTIPSTSLGGNILSYAIENQNNGVTGGMSFSGGSKLYVGRSGTTIYVAAGGNVSFDASTSLTWTSTGAAIKVSGTGTVTGITFAPGGSTIGADPAVPPNVSGN